MLRRSNARRVVVRVALVVAALFDTSGSLAAQGDCAQPVSIGSTPTATDSLAILRASVGLQSCELCVCDIDRSGSTVATDALSGLRIAVGQVVERRCVGCLVSQVIGTSGGAVTSADGKITLTFPAGAIAADTEITIEGTAPSNLGDEFDDFSPEEGYTLGPDGLALALPARVTYAQGGDGPLQEDGSIVAELGVLLTSEGGVTELLGNQSTSIDLTVNEARSFGDLSHFSEMVASSEEMIFAVRNLPDSCPVGGSCFTANAEITLKDGVDETNISQVAYTDISHGQIRPTAPPIRNVALDETAPNTFTGSFDYSCEPNLGDPDEYRALGSMVQSFPVEAREKPHSVIVEKPIKCEVEQACASRDFPQCDGACPPLQRCLPDGNTNSCDCVPLVDMCSGFGELAQCSGTCPGVLTCAADVETTLCDCVGCGNGIIDLGEQCDGNDNLACVGGDCASDCVCENACDGQGDCTGGFACLFGLCLPECDGSDDCEEDHVCSVPGNIDDMLRPGCFPGLPDGFPEGAPCTEHDECFSAFCEAVLGECASFCLLFAGEGELDAGVPAINGNAGCDGGYCIEFFFSQGRGVCGTSCERDADCGEGRVCRLARDSEQNVYRPACFVASDARADAGEACGGNAECNSSNCMTPPADQSACVNNGDCGSGEFCSTFRRCALPLCTAHCATNDDCLPALPNCVALDIPTPDGLGTQNLDVCAP